MGFSGPRGHKEGIAFMVAKSVERSVSMALRVMGMVLSCVGYGAPVSLTDAVTAAEGKFDGQILQQMNLGLQ